MTPAEWTTHVEGIHWREDQEFRREVGMLWLGEHFTRSRALKPLQEYLDPVVATELSPEEAQRQQLLQEEVARRMKRFRARGGGKAGKHNG